MTDPGEVIGGFRVGRLIGRGSRGSVYEALQVSLDRPVALRLLEPTDFASSEDEAGFLTDQQTSASLHHPGIVPTYEAGEWEGGRFVATRYIGGRTLAEVIDAGEMSDERADAIGAQVKSALAAAHAAGLIHGAVSARNVLVERSGGPLLADLGLGRPGTAVDDDRALADLGRLLERAAGERRRRRLRGPIAAAAVVALTVAALLVTSGSADEDPSARAAPAVTAGAQPFGSELAPGSASSVGCAAEPDPNTPLCTIAQAETTERSARIREAGAIRGWAVRNATGDLSLQVIGFDGGKAFLRSFSQVESAESPGPQAFATDISVERGDLVGVTLAPGASIGSRELPNTETLRWDGTLPYAPESLTPARSNGELLLRYDVAVGERPRLEQISGPRAATAPKGAALAVQTTHASDGSLIRAELTRVGSGLVIDSFKRGERLARAEVEGADANGRLLSFQAQCGFERGFCLRWQNEGAEETLIHAYRVTGDGTFDLIG